jgi:multiple sugar transport system substrate-binding protein
MRSRHPWRGLLAGIGLLLGTVMARAEPITLKVWMHEHPPRIAIDRAIIAEFEKAHPDIKIDYQVIGASEYPTKLLTAFASGGGPDIFNHNVQLAAQYYNSRILAPIDFAAMGYANEQELTAKYASGFDGIRFAGKLYGVPTEVSNFACYLNNALWKGAGLDPAKDFPTTWEAMPAVAEKLTGRDANGNPIRRGFDFDWPSGPVFWLTMTSMMHQNGGNLIDEDSYSASFSNPTGIKVLQFLVDWTNKNKLGGPQYTDTRTAFLSGQLATDCSFGIWGIPQMADAKIDFTVHPAPRFAGGVDEGFDAYAYYMGVNARSPAATQKAAWAYVRYYTDQAERLFVGAGLFVPRAEVAAKATDANSKVFLDELKKAKFAPRVVGYGQVMDAMLRGRDRMMQGGEPVASVLPELQDQVNVVLKRERAKAEAMRQ